MKWLVYGYKGWIGQRVCQILNDLNEEVINGQARVDQESDVEQEIQKCKPDRVISLIGRTYGPGFTTIDYLEQKGKILDNIRDNLYGPMVLAILCQKYNIHLTYMGTGCIFTFDETHLEDEGERFSEEDKPNFFGSGYSVCKGFTDRLMKFYGDTVLNVRIRMPITEDDHPRNFITKITTYEKICSIRNSMTVLPEILPLMIDLALKGQTGTINMTNPGGITHNEILEMYKEIVDPDFTYQNFTLEEQSKILLSGRSNNVLDTTKLESLYPEVRPIREAVRGVLEKIKVNRVLPN